MKIKYTSSNGWYRVPYVSKDEAKDVDGYFDCPKKAAAKCFAKAYGVTVRYAYRVILAQELRNGTEVYCYVGIR